YGGDLALAGVPGAHVRPGRMGVEARRRELLESGARLVLDATHPHAAEISRQLIALSRELDIPYLRFERPGTPAGEGAETCASPEEAAARAIQLGSRIFLATGSRDLPVFLGAPGAAERAWFARMTPDPQLLARAEALGIPRARLCAMQGPFTRDFNEALWRGWQIDCVVSKDSGEAGGFAAKRDAARALGIPLVVVARPAVEYPRVVNDAAAVHHFLDRMGALT
ncbi:MAG: precorrin-6A reductase, partial [Gemmatimonadetes bacterium]|nr:precorrin-6A reductase [Gemmatimonadota bacterium]